MYETIDLHFQNQTKNIASFAIPIQQEGAIKWILFETGPYSCYPHLVEGLKQKGISITDVVQVFLTHIHLDHAGGAWKLAEQGATIHVHPVGAPFMIYPEKLVQSATRIYGDEMESLWSTIKGIHPEKVVAVEDGASYSFSDPQGKAFRVRAHHTPGHASHHIAWQVEKTLFAGDVLGIRTDDNLLDIPAPPPDFHPDLWLKSIAKIKKLNLDEVVLTHFGGYSDIEFHLDRVENRIWEITGWFRGQLRTPIKKEEVERKFVQFIKDNYAQNGMSPEAIAGYLKINPPFMTVMGVLRYLKKYENLSCVE